MFNQMMRMICLVMLVTLMVIPSNANTAPSTTNAIKFYIPYLTIGDQADRVQVTEKATNQYEYKGEPLLDNDTIRYFWSGVDLSEEYITNPSDFGAYLKVYLNDDLDEANLITNHGTSPLPISKLKPKLAPGSNTILIVVIDSATAKPIEPLTKIELTFDYSTKTPNPSITIQSPGQDAVIASDINKDFRVEVVNFKITDTGEQINEGKLKVYYNSIDPSNLIHVETKATESNGKNVVSFNSENVEAFKTVPDSINTKLIFILENNRGELIDATKQELIIKTNYGRTVDTGLPSVKILEPQNNQEITTQTQFKIDVKNFNLLQGFNSETGIESQGYLQIRINDNLINKLDAPTEFTLQDIAQTSLTGSVTIKVNLATDNFKLLEPDASDLISVNVINEKKGAEDVIVRQNYWRLILMACAVVLILGSVAILITKG